MEQLCFLTISNDLPEDLPDALAQLCDAGQLAIIGVRPGVNAWVLRRADGTGAVQLDCAEQTITGTWDDDLLLLDGGGAVHPDGQIEPSSVVIRIADAGDALAAALRQALPHAQVTIELRQSQGEGVEVWLGDDLTSLAIEPDVCATIHDVQRELVAPARRRSRARSQRHQARA